VTRRNPSILLNLALYVHHETGALGVPVLRRQDQRRCGGGDHEDVETNRHVAAEVGKILRMLDERGQILTLSLEQRHGGDRPGFRVAVLPAGRRLVALSPAASLPLEVEPATGSGPARRFPRLTAYLWASTIRQRGLIQGRW
jgi:hypothetical protein